MSEHDEVMEAIMQLRAEIAQLRADLRLSPATVAAEMRLLRAKATAQANAKNRVLTFSKLKEKGWPYSRASTWRMIKEGRFLKPFRLDNSPRNLWMEDQVDAFLAANNPPKSSGSRKRRLD